LTFTANSFTFIIHHTPFSSHILYLFEPLNYISITYTELARAGIMISNGLFSIAGLAFLLLNVAEAVDTKCVLKSNPPAGANCGVLGYLSNEDSYDTYTFDSQYASPAGCAKGCAARSNCVSWYLGSHADYLFCEWHTDTTAAAGFYPYADSYYYGYDQSCFTCGPVEVSCPDSDGTQFSVGAAVFNIHCGTDYYGGDLARVDAATFGDCLASCASTMGCIDVAYNGNSCYMKSSLNTARQNSNVWGAVLASAEQSAAQQMTCPTNDGATYTAKSGDQFLIQCGADYYGGDLSSLWAETFEDCLEACDTTSGCLDVAYHHPGYCYLKNTLTAPQQNSDVWGAKKLSAPAPKRRSELPPTSRYVPNDVPGVSGVSPKRRSDLPPTLRYVPQKA
jgi:PAN domain